nr:alpha-isopropylmalate synthase regulatory domain-containing protein [Microbacterium sp. MYb62]
MIDFSDIDEIRRTVEHCNRIEVHARHPYVGDLVHTAFSGTHQDAIRKGLAEHRARAAAEGRPEDEIEWRVPYLPIDPADIGRDYDAVIRVNSQSGKGGIAHLLETEYGIELPRRLQIDFARHVQRHTDSTGAEVTAPELWEVFSRAYLRATNDADRVALLTSDTAETGARSRTRLTLRVDGREAASSHDGVGPVEALTAALDSHGFGVDVVSLHQTSIGTGDDSDALTLIEHRTPEGVVWSAGRARSVLAASMAAVVAAANGIGPGPRDAGGR